MIDFNALQENDKLHIPGDTGGTWRLEKFIDFHHNVKVVDQTMLVEYAKRNEMTPDEIVLFFWLLSSTYSEISAIFLFNDIKRDIGWENVTEQYINNYWIKNKQNLQFGSARKYAKNMDWFPVLIIDFLKKTNYQPYVWLKKLTNGLNPEESYSVLYKDLDKMRFTGRFSIELFLMNFRFFFLDNLLDINIEENVTFDWRKYANETSGLFNLFYKDEAANMFDKTKRVSDEDIAFLNEAIVITKNMIAETCSEVESLYLMFMPQSCTFRNFCKKMRYSGFHHDRQLGFIKIYESKYPGNPIWNEIYDIRKTIYPNNLLGELHGWSGIRTERKKLFVERGLLGHEEPITKLFW